jgi:hypothetical protein
LSAPGLATILVGEDPASAVYVANKVKACEEVGFNGFHRSLAADSSENQVRSVIDELNDDPQVHGILLQLPVPDHLDGGALSGLISSRKDVDGLTVTSVGALALGKSGLRPCTPSGVIELLDRSGVEIEGANAVVIGRSDLVGKPQPDVMLRLEYEIEEDLGKKGLDPGIVQVFCIVIAEIDEFKEKALAIALITALREPHDVVQPAAQQQFAPQDLHPESEPAKRFGSRVTPERTHG